MVQTGVPFGEVAAVQGWLGIEGAVGKPRPECPKRPVEGFACRRSEVSGRRLWGLFAERFGTPAAFFADHFVANYCPLAFMGPGGRNLTPDKLPSTERGPLEAACDEHLARLIEALEPEWCIGVGGFATACLGRVATGGAKVGTVLHPSPASPAANRGWAGAATAQLEALGVW
jgi:single-strand selective monofunctional uracil DNA glycosylase